jgi:hypothetical protein
VSIVAAGLPERDAELAAIPQRPSIKAVNAPARAKPAPLTMFVPAATPQVPEGRAPLSQPRPESVLVPVMTVVPRELEMPAPTPIPVADPAPVAGIRPLCTVPVATVIDVPTIELRHDAELVLTIADALDVRAGAERIRANRPIRSRANSASLVDRIYFATRDLKRHWERRDKPSGQPAMPRPPRAPRIMQPGAGLSA